MSFFYYTNPYWNSGGVGSQPPPPRSGGYGSDHEHAVTTRKIVQRIIEKAKRVEIGLIPAEQAMGDPELALLLDQAYKSLSTPVIRNILLEADDEDVMLLTVASQVLD